MSEINSKANLEYNFHFGSIIKEEIKLQPYLDGIKSEFSNDNFYNTEQKHNINETDTNIKLNLERNTRKETVFIMESSAHETDKIKVETTDTDTIEVDDQNKNRGESFACDDYDIKSEFGDDTCSNWESKMDSESDEISTPPEITEVASFNLLPEKTQKLYASVYKLFMDWKLAKKATSFSESVLLVYFSELSQKYKSSTLWTYYSMLRSTLSINEGVNIENYVKLRAFLKKRSEGFQSKKANTFTGEDINKFLTEAPDYQYLETKTALIMGVIGGCRANEMYQMKTDDFQDLGSAYLIRVPNTKTKRIRNFTITDKFYEICKKYASLRPSTITSNIFFLNYQYGNCTTQRTGINKFTTMARQIATYLNLPNPEKYSGHSFQRSSATVQQAGGDTTVLKRHGGWRSTAVAEGYIDNSEKNKMDTANKISTAVEDKPSTSYQCTQNISTSNQNFNVYVNSMPSIQLSNCSNVNISINVNK